MIPKTKAHFPGTPSGGRGRKVLLTAAMGVLFLLALLLTLYPVISTHYNEAHQTKARAEYEEILAQTDTEEFDRLRSAAVAYNKSLIPGVSTDGYSEEYLQSASEDYVNQLAVSGSEIMGYVEIPKIQVYLPIYHGTGADSLERGVGHLLGSSLPVGGTSTHTILTGHSGMASQKLFTDLEQLESGDVFYLHILDMVLAYQVTGTETVLPHDTSYLGIEQGQDLCTLVTCYPTGVNTHRLLVQGERMEYTQAQQAQIEAATEESNTESQWENQYWLGIQMGLLAAFLAAAIGGMLLLVRGKKPKRKVGRYERV